MVNSRTVVAASSAREGPRTSLQRPAMRCSEITRIARVFRAAAAIALGVIFGLVILAVVGLGARGGEWVFVAVSVVISATLSVAVLVRFGVLSAIGAQWVVFLTSQVPVTFDWSAPYAEASWLIVATILALTIYGFRTTLAGPIAVTRFEPQH